MGLNENNNSEPIVELTPHEELINLVATNPTIENINKLKDFEDRLNENNNSEPIVELTPHEELINLVATNPTIENINKLKDFEDRLNSSNKNNEMEYINLQKQ